MTPTLWKLEIRRIPSWPYKTPAPTQVHDTTVGRTGPNRYREANVVKKSV